IAGAGDVDLDGFADYVVGSPYFDGNGLADTGIVVVYSGAAGGVLWSDYGTVAGAQYGSAVSGAGGLHGNGEPDLLLSQVVNGSVSALDDAGNILYGVGGAYGSFGASLAKAGDIDGDGVADWYAGSPLEDTYSGGTNYLDTGAVYACSGATGNTIYRFG